MTYKQLNHYGKVRNVIVERCGRTYEAYHTMDHGTTAICDTIVEAKEAVDDLARQHNTANIIDEKEIAKMVVYAFVDYPLRQDPLIEVDILSEETGLMGDDNTVLFVIDGKRFKATVEEVTT